METIETETKLCMILDGLDSYLSELYDASIQGTACQKVLSDEEQGAVVGLFNSCHETEKSLVILLRHNQVFDAIALMRSLAEGSVRALYMLSPSLDEVHSRIKEYMEELPRDTYVNIGKRARSINDQVPNRDDDYRKMIDELAQLGRDGTLDEIRKRWSFANIFKNQKSEEWGAARLSRIQILYALSSDLLHKGYTTNQLRSEIEQDIVGYMSLIMFLLYDLADMRCEVIAGRDVTAPLSQKHGAVICGILAMNAIRGEDEFNS